MLNTTNCRTKYSRMYCLDKLGTAARITESYGFGARQSNTATSWNIDSRYSILVVLFLSCNTDAETNLIAPKRIASENEPRTIEEVEQPLSSD